MTLFKTRYGAAIQRVLAQYPPNSRPLAIALELIVMTATENTKGEVREEIAASVCEGFHEGPGRGLVCKLCYEAAIVQKVEQAGLLADEVPSSTRAEEQERDDIAQQVKAILGEDE